jgi:RNA polymerase sigma factor (sigma-70 family)
MELTTEQKQMVEDNIRLAYSTALKMVAKSPLEYDDILSICFLGLIKTAQKFDPSKGFAFSTYAINTMRWMVHKEANPRKPQIKASYFEDLIPTEWESNWENIIAGDSSLEDDLINNIFIGQVREKINHMKLSPKSKEVLQVYFDNPELTQEEVAQIAGCTQGTVSETYKKLAEQCQAEIKAI